MTVATMGVRRALVMLAAVAALNLFAEGEPKMPMLNWMGREKATKSVKDVVMKILREDKSLSYGTDDNLLVHGDNLEALKALLPFYAGQVKCIYIDPPYNTGSAFEHYDDNLEHSTWLNMMYPRLKLLREFLREDGSIWVNLDDNEVHYCRVIMDEIFGRQNFMCDVAWEKRYSPPPDTKDIGYIHDHILVYRKSAMFSRNLLPLTDDQKGRYKNPDNDPRGSWKAADYTCRFSAQQRPNLFYPIIHPVTGEEVWPKETRVWANSREEHEKNVRENRLWWGKDGKARVPAKKNFLSDIQQGMMPMSLWHYEFAGTNQDGKKENLKLFGNLPFGTPKPEKLISIVLTIATNPGDLVLDSFLGSGTTTAVAQKMGRRWIGIEMGDHAKTHCVVRMKKVVDGEQGGISKSVKWQGGGGFRYYELGEAILKEDGSLTSDIPFEVMAAHVWFSETKTPYAGDKKSTVLGVHEGTAYVLLYNGILKDRSVNGGNVLTRKTLEVIQADLAAHEDGSRGRSPSQGARPPEYEKIVVYGEACRLMASTLQALKIEFRQTPYDLVTRR